MKREQLRFPVSGLTSYKELQNSYGYDSSTDVISLKKVMINEKEARVTGFEIGAVCWELIRTRAIDQKK